MSLPEMFCNLTNLNHDPSHQNKQINKKNSVQKNISKQKILFRKRGQQNKGLYKKQNQLTQMRSIEKIIQKDTEQQRYKSQLIIDPCIGSQRSSQDNELKHATSEMHLKQKIKILTNNHQILDVFDEIAFIYNQVVQKINQNIQKADQDQPSKPPIAEQHSLSKNRKKIKELQEYTKYLKLGIVEKRQKITIMEGQYQLKIEELNDQLDFTRKELRKIHQEYILSNSQKVVYLQKIKDLQKENVQIKRFYQQYIQQFKSMIKLYINNNENKHQVKQQKINPDKQELNTKQCKNQKQIKDRKKHMKINSRIFECKIKINRKCRKDYGTVTDQTKIQTNECGFNAKPQTLQTGIDNSIETNECGFNAKPQTLQTGIDNSIETNECGFNAKPQTRQIGICSIYSSNLLLTSSFSFSFVLHSPIITVPLSNHLTFSYLQQTLIRYYLFPYKEIFFSISQNDFNLLPRIYLLSQKMYVFQVTIKSNKQKFVITKGKIIHYGTKVQFMELTSYSKKFNQFSGSNVMLGNGEVRISKNKIKIKRVLKQRIFEGEMQNGEWTINKVWIVQQQ